MNVLVNQRLRGFLHRERRQDVQFHRSLIAQDHYAFFSKELFVVIVDELTVDEHIWLVSDNLLYFSLHFEFSASSISATFILESTLTFKPKF
jgi:hypothetical protein